MRPIKRAIILCWIMLVACFAIKLFGGNWFEVVCANEHFLFVCDFVENSIFLYNFISYFVYVIPQSFIVLSICDNTNPSKIDLIYILSALSIIWSMYFISPTVKYIMEFVLVGGSCLFYRILSKNKNQISLLKSFVRGILGLVLVLCFQAISLFTRNVDINIYNYSLLVTSIMLIDYYIMVFLFYLYVKLKKERSKE
jgi:hypothetical protein